MRRLRLLRPISHLCLLAGVICGSAAWGEVKPPLLQIGRADDVTVDGRIGADEWAENSALRVFVDPGGSPVSPGAVIRVGWNDVGLVILWELPGRPSAQRRGRDAEFWRDDAVELRLIPGEDASDYRFAISASGDLFDARDGDSGWDVPWRAIAVVGGTEWRVEMQIPFAALGSGVPSFGDLWRANFIIHSASGDTPPLGWAPPTAGGEDAPGFLRLAADPSPVTLSGVSLSAEGATITPAISADAGLRTELIEGDSPVLTLETSEAAAFEVPIERTGEYRLRLAGIAADGELTLQREFSVTRRPPLVLSAQTRMLQRREISLSMDARGLATQPDAFVVAVAGVPAAEIPAADSRMIEALIDLSEHPTGAVTIEVAARADGADLASAELDVTLPEKPAWAERTAEREEPLGDPWTPVEIVGHRVGSANCAYDFGDGLLPQSIRALGEELLREPMALRVRAGGRRAQWSQVMLRWTEMSDRSATALVVARSEVADARVTATCLYDGLMTLSLRISPRGERSLEQVQLLLPVVARHADLLQIADGSADGIVTGDVSRSRSAHEFAPLVWLSGERRGLQWLCGSDRGWQRAKPDETVVVQRGRDETRLVVMMLDHEMLPGLSFETDFALQPTPVALKIAGRSQPRLPEEPVIVQDGRDEPRFVVTVFDAESLPGVPFGTDHLSEPITMAPRAAERPQPRLATLAEAPLVDGHSDLEALRSLRHAGIDAVVLDDRRFQPRPGGLDAEEDALLREIIEGCHATDLELLVVIDDDLSGAEWDAWRNEVAATSGESSAEGAIPRGCPNSAWGDYVVAAVEDGLDRYGIDGIHLRAGTAPRRCVSALHGCGWREYDRSGPTWEITATRDLLSRLRAAIDRRIDGGIISVELSGGTFAPGLAFADRVLLPGVDDEGDALESSEFRARGGRPALGLPVEVALPPAHDIRAFEAALSLALLHGADLRPVAETVAVETASRVRRALQSFDADTARFRPYWRPGTAVTTENTAVALTAWTRPGGALVALSNRTGSSQLVELSVDRRALSLGRRYAAENVLTGDEVRQIGEVLRTRLEPRETALLSISTRETEASDNDGTAEDTPGE